MGLIGRKRLPANLYVRSADGWRNRELLGVMRPEEIERGLRALLAKIGARNEDQEVPMEPNREELERRIKYHRPDSDGINRIAIMRRLALDFSLGVMELVPEGRERALALTKIEEALFWSNAGIARDPDHWAEEGD